MDPARLDEIRAWIVQAGLAGIREGDLLRKFCNGVCEAGVPLSRALVVIDTLDPVHEGHVFRWRSDNATESEVHGYGRTSRGGDAAEGWRRSPFYHMLQSGAATLRRRIGEGGSADFAILEELRAEGQTDYLAFVQRFAEGNAIGEMDCVHSSWVTAEPAGFADEDVVALEALVPPLALALKAASLARIAEVLLETYLGRDAGRRVLSSGIERGIAERIEAVLWFSDLRGFTAISDQSRPEDLIPFLNDYAEAVISAIHEAGGDVLKLMGDGTLAIFTADNPMEAARAALDACRLAGLRLRELNARRSAAGLPVTRGYLGLHIGEVFFGNIGATTRLDFTVVGPAVNEVSRISAMCRSVERDVLVSSAFRDAVAPEERDSLVSVGRYALRGIAQPQELFTLVAAS